jgi:hypothetical protein
MASSKKSPKEICTSQERFPTTQDGLVTNTKPTDYYVDYPREDKGPLEVPLPASGHDSFMYRSHTKGKQE